MTPCPAEDTLLQLQEGRLSEAEHGPVEAHVEGCAACQGKLDQLSPEGRPSLLPLLQRGALTLGDTHAGAPQAAEIPRVPGYLLLEILGTGGMGVVYRARHLALRREVALKMLLAHRAQGPDHLMALTARFQREAEAVARLQHPNIIQIFDVGLCDDGPYFAMEHVAGGTLAGRLRGTPQNPREAAALVETLARAVHYAHECGVVHRDLKPGNVLLKVESGELRAESQKPLALGTGLSTLGFPKIVDFGLAKQLDEDTGQTQSGAILGTPSYMAPEQAAGKSPAIGPRADVYALGAILYELLTGRPPFKGETTLDTLEQVRGQEPVPVRQLQPKAPRDLETICLNCLQKGPHRRYASAAALAEGPRRFQAGEPIAARPVGRLGRAWRWARRNPRVAGLSAAVALLVAAVAVGSTAAAVLLAAANAEAEASATKEHTARLEADRSAGKAKDEEKKALKLARSEHKARLDKAEALASARANLRRLTVGQGLGRLGEGDLLASLPYLTDALAGEETDGQPDPLHRLRLAAVLRQRPRLAQLWVHDGLVSHVAFAPDGRRLLTTSWDGTARVWDADQGTPVAVLRGHKGPVTHGAFSPDGRRVLTGGEDHTARLWDARTGAPLGQPLRLTIPIAHVAFSPGDGRFFLAAGGHKNADPHQTVTTPGPDTIIPQFDAKGMPRAPLRIPGAPITRHVTPRGYARVWEADTGQPLGKPLFHSGWINRACFSPDGRLVVTAGGRPTGKNEAGLWDLAEGKLRRRLPHRAPVQAAAFAPDGKRLATAGGKWSGDRGEAWLWDVATGEPLAPGLPHPRQVVQVSFSPDGARLLTACADGAARLWDAATGTALGSPLRHPEPLTTAAFSPDGRQVLTAGQDRTARLWDAATGAPVTPLLRHASPLTAAAFSPEGHRLATACRDGTVRVWELAPPATGPAPLEHAAAVTFAAFTPDGRHVLTCTGRRELAVFSAGTREQASDTARTDSAWLWDAAAGEPVSGRLPHDDALAAPALSGDGRQALTVGHEEKGQPTVWLWEVATGKSLHSWPLPPNARVQTAAFSADGRAYIVTAEPKQMGLRKPMAGWEVRLLDGADGRTLAGPLPHPAEVRAAALSPDGRRLATVAADRGLRLWDAVTGAALGPPLAHEHLVHALRFSPDGKRLLAYATDRTAPRWDMGPLEIDAPGKATVHVWELATGRRLVLRHPGAVLHADFRADGARVLTAGADGSARVWDAATGTPAGPPLEHRGAVTHAAFSPDGRHVVTAGEDRSARVWDVATGEPVTPPLAHPGRILVATFTPDGRRVLTGASDGRARFWDLTPEGRPAAELVRLAEVLCGHRLDEKGGLVPLEPAALRTAWAELRAKSPADLAPTPRPQVAAWHARQANACEQAGEWFAATVHLDALLADGHGDWRLWLRRARAWLGLERWDRAADDAARALTLGADHPDAWHFLALARLQRGETEGYRQLCVKLLEHLGHTEQPETARAVVRVCVLAPGGIAEGDGAGLLRLARLGGPAEAHAPGAVLYRTGAWREAVRALEAAGKAAPEGRLFLAMAYHRTGESAKARQLLEAAAAFESLLNRRADGAGPRPDLPTAVVQQYSGKRTVSLARHVIGGPTWERRLGLALLLREARTLIEGAK